MKKALICLIVLHISVFSQKYSAPVQHIFMQGNNINTVFSTDGVFNCDRTTFPSQGGGFIWPVTSSQRMTADFATGLWVGAKVGAQHELRLAAAFYNSHFTPGNIPVIGQVPPQSVCNDPNYRGYLVNLNDESLVNGGVRIKTAGGLQYTFNYDSWVNWPVNLGAPYVEVNNIPGYQPSWNGDRPGIGNGSTARPDDISFMVYMDYTNCTNEIHQAEISLPGGTLPLGVEIQQIAFMFNCPVLKDMYFIKWKIMNKSLQTWDSTYITMANDADIGSDACGAGDDAAGCDTIRSLGFMYNGDNNDCNYGTNPPALGSRLLQSPLKFTGNNNDTAYLPYDTLIGYKLVGMNVYNIFTNGSPDSCTNDPDHALAGYNFMKGFDGCGNPFINPVTGLVTKFKYSGNSCNRTGWVDNALSDRRYIQSSGPLTMNSGDTQIVVMGFVINRSGSNNFQNICALQSMSDSALKYYYKDFATCTSIGIQPISSEIPVKFALYQNYPNPFNPVTQIKFNIAKSGNAKITIYDAIGRQITKLLDEQLTPGTYRADWDASNYPSGVYFYKLTTEYYTQTKKMVLVK
jgi:hypothetical protein